MGKKKTPQKGRTSEQSITESGLCIYKKGGQIKTLTNKRWDVASESEEGKWYRVSFDCNRPTCECAYHTTGNGCRCKHIAAIEHLILSETKSDCSKVDDKEELISTPVQECPKCHSKKFVCNGWYTGKSGKKQRYKCKKCNHRFRDNLGFEYRHTSPMYITLCLLLYGAGLSVVILQHTLSHMGIIVSTNTITRWLEHYTGMAEKYTDPIRPPNLGAKLSADEKRQDIRGRESYMVMAMDMATRFILAWEVSPIKKGYNATNLLRKAQAKAGKPYRIFITDGLVGYHTGFRKVFGVLKGLVIHIRDIHIKNQFCNTNMQERLNGTLGDRCHMARGLNSDNSLTYRIFILHYNYIRPHTGLGGMTPAEAANIQIPGTDKWLTLIQQAAIAQ